MPEPEITSGEPAVGQPMMDVGGAVWIRTNSTRPRHWHSPVRNLTVTYGHLIRTYGPLAPMTAVGA